MRPAGLVRDVWPARVGSGEWTFEVDEPKIGSPKKRIHLRKAVDGSSERWTLTSPAKINRWDTTRE
jgi:hypothetical protein